jgi:hypothetical protein
MVRLSKSRIMASLQCLKRIWLEVNRPQLARYPKSAQASFEQGHAVGALAVRLYGGDSGTYIPYSGGSFARQLTQTRDLMDSLFRAPIFEATLQHDGVLVREDVLLPVESSGGRSWRVVEVKASASVKDVHLHDCAIQAWVHLQSGHPLDAIAVAHIDTTFVYAGSGDFRGLLVEHDLSDEVFALVPAVPEWVQRARDAAQGSEPDVAVGQHCSDPWDCPFMAHCWPGEARYPIGGLKGSRKKLGIWVMNGYRDIRDVPAAEISSETQQRIHRITRKGVPELLPGARRFVEDLGYPRYYLDFETVAPAIPLWPGTRPYQALPIQWSCHVETGPGSLEHAEFLDLGDAPPMRPLAAALIDTLGRRGPVLMYTAYERGVIRSLAAMFPDLAGALEAIDLRLVDLHPVTRQNYYHPDMLGSWSIKAVLPTIAPDMDYAALAGIQEGTEASTAYLEAIDADTAPERRAELRRDLLDYCRHDTEAMVRLVHFFAGIGPAPGGSG